MHSSRSHINIFFQSASTPDPQRDAEISRYLTRKVARSVFPSIRVDIAPRRDVRTGRVNSSTAAVHACVARPLFLYLPTVFWPLLRNTTVPRAHVRLWAPLRPPLLSPSTGSACVSGFFRERFFEIIVILYTGRELLWNWLGEVSIAGFEYREEWAIINWIKD